MTENKKDYKKTKLGWIPNEWNICKGIDITERITKGASPKWQGFNYQKEGVLFVTSENVRAGYLDISTPKFLPLSFNEKQKSSVLKSGDILINIVGASIGRSCLFQELVTANINQAVSVFRPNSKVNKEYLLQFLNFEITVNRLLAIQSDGARPNLSLTDLKLFQFLLPPLPEQQKIAKILSTWDKAIDKLSQLIAQEEKHKKGLMQVLLTGKVRFDGFTEMWEDTLVSNVFEFIHTNSFSRSNMEYNTDNKSVYNIHYGDIHATFKEPILDFEKENKTPVLLKDTELPKSSVFLNEGDLVMADASEDYAGVGKTVELKNIKDKKVVGGLHTFVLRDKSEKTLKGFRTYIFKHPTVSNSVKVIATGSKVYGISKTNLAKVKLFLPPITEQQKIASILSSADAAIEKLKSQLEILKEQKKGLMQELLTGKNRVKI